MIVCDALTTPDMDKSGKVTNNYQNFLPLGCLCLNSHFVQIENSFLVSCPLTLTS